MGGVSEPWGNASGWEEDEEKGSQQDEEEEPTNHVRGVDRNARQFCLRRREGSQYNGHCIMATSWNLSLVATV